MAILQINYAGQNYFAEGDRTALRRLLTEICHGAESGGNWVVLPGGESDAALFASPGVPMAVAISYPDDEVHAVADLFESKPSKAPRRLM